MPLPISRGRRNAIDAAVRVGLQLMGAAPQKGTKRDFGEMRNCELVTHTYVGPNGPGRDVIVQLTHGGKQYVGRFAFDGPKPMEHDFEEVPQGVR